jgi:DNA-binding winged helix-turn-helix (wHTH) protein
MEPNGSSFNLIAFDRFEVDLRSGELRRKGQRVRLQEQPFQLLALLLEHPGEVVTRIEICRRLWHADTFVDFDHSLATAVNKIREALGDSAECPQFIETLPRRGYRFVGAITAPVRAPVQSPPQAPEQSPAAAELIRPDREAVRRPWLTLAVACAAFVASFGAAAVVFRSIRAKTLPTQGQAQPSDGASIHRATRDRDGPGVLSGWFANRLRVEWGSGLRGEGLRFVRQGNWQ